MIDLRPATAGDASFLQQVLAVAADWRPGVRRSVEEVMAVPSLARYVAGWPRAGDVGFVAQDGALGAPLGGAWWRCFTTADHGYGFVDEATPELSIGVLPDGRGQGVGTLLLQTLVQAARQRRIPALSLSVEPDNNRAARLYARLGFEVVDTDGGSLTMVLRVLE